MQSMNSKKPIIIKLGGSVLTDKYSPGIINYKALAELSIALTSCTEPLILIHGAGSLGHPEAQKWGIMDGLTADNAPGIYETHEAVSSLNLAVVKMLREDGINAVSFPPFAAALSAGKRLTCAGEKQLEKLLAAGYIPVLYGDTVMDTEQGVCIVSGDQLAQYLARTMHAQRVGIITEAGGVLTDGKVLAEITPETLGSVEFTEAESIDVTGGMKGKVNELIELARTGTPSQIFAPEDLPAFLNGGCPGTRISNGGNQA